jgi:cytochrome c-type biogenesis protein CcmH/NrfG
MPYSRPVRCNKTSTFSLMLACLFLLAACASARAQVGGIEHSGTGGQHTIQGRIVFPSGKRADTRLKVRLENTGEGDLSVMADSNGSFSFRSLRPGTYTVVIDGGELYETVREPVYIESATIRTRSGGMTQVPMSRPFTIQVYLQPKRQPGASNKSGVVNAALAGVPKAALDLYNKALASARNRENSKAIEQLKGALQIHPDFALALAELGVLYMMEKQPDEAILVLRAALKLSPDEYTTLLTYGRALYDKGRFTEAEEQFRKALQNNTASPSAHFYIGLILLKRNDLDGGEKAFKSAVELGGDQIAVAHKYLGGIYWAKRDYKQAADELETYLRLMPDAEDAARVRATIKEFRAKK